MSALLPSIELNVRSKLNDRDYRQAFFLAESSASIAKQLIALRKRRELNQTQLAEAVGTGQPAISRIERADYRNWSFNTLRRAAEALDARLRVYIEPSEDVLWEYESEAASTGFQSAASAGIEYQVGQQSTLNLAAIADLPVAQVPRMSLDENKRRAEAMHGIN